MKKSKVAHLSLSVPPREREQLSWEERIDISFITLLVTLGSALLLAELHETAWLLPAAIALACSALAVLLQCTRRRGWCLPVCLLLALVLGVIFLTPVRNALAATANQVLQWRTGRESRVYFTYTDGAQAALWPLLCVVLPVVAALSAWVSFGARRWPLLLLLPVVVLAAMGLLPVRAGLVLLGLATAWQLLRGVRLHGAKGLLPHLAICLLVCLLAGGCAALGGSQLDAASDTLRTHVARWAHSLRYDEASNAMPEGWLQNLSAWAPDDTAALSVTMDEPQKLYLRGFVGEAYTGQCWQAPEEAALCENADLFYWLHQSDFYGQGVLASAYQALEQTTAARITVENLSACSAHYFLPYAANVSTLADERKIGDREIDAAQTQYTAYYYPGSIPQWFTLQNELAAAAETTELTRYRVSEQAYQAYAQENDLALPEAVRTLLAEELDELGTAMTLSEIKDTILNYLESHLTYQPSVVTENGDTDFVLYTLLESPYGYSVHYATIATMIFRYYGIPARYCEGYFLSGEQAAMYEPGETITLDETFSHAWPEYYLQGVGWMPFEVTPGYVDKEELEGEGLGGTGRTYMAPQHEPEQTPEDTTQTQHHAIAAFSIWWLVALLGAVLVFFAVLLCLRRTRLRRALRRIAAAEDKTAIALRYGYAAWLMRYGGQSEATDDYTTARQLQLEALYSTHPMTAEQREWMDTFAAQVLAQCCRTWNRRQRWYYHWIKCLY